MTTNIKDALRLAAADPGFAKELVENPAKFQATYNLSDAQIEQIKSFAFTPETAEGSPALSAAGYESGSSVEMEQAAAVCEATELA